MFSVTATCSLQLHAQLLVFHKGPLFLSALLFKFGLQTVDLGLELCDVALSLQKGKK